MAALFALLALPAPCQTTEDIQKERALLDVKKKLLDQEIDRFKSERREWELRKETESTIRSAAGLTEADLDAEARKKNVINKVIAGGFAGFLEKFGRTGSRCRVVMVTITIAADGDIENAKIEDPAPAKEISEKILKIARSLDFSALTPASGPVTHTFPLLIAQE